MSLPFVITFVIPFFTNFLESTMFLSPCTAASPAELNFLDFSSSPTASKDRVRPLINRFKGISWKTS